MATNSPSFAATQYGAPIGEYRGSIRNPITIGISGTFSLILGIVFLTLVPPSGDTSGMVFASIFFIAIGLFFLGGMVWKILRGRSAHAQLFEQGFVISRGGERITARWNEIFSVTQSITRVAYNGIPVGTTYLFTISLANGETVRVDNTFGKTGQLGDAIQRMSANALLPRAIASYQSGASLPFGKISISQAGISNDKETVPWSNIKQVTVQNGGLIIKRNDKRLAWVNTPVAKTPNIYVLMALVDRIQHGAL